MLRFNVVIQSSFFINYLVVLYFVRGLLFALFWTVYVLNHIFDCRKLLILAYCFVYEI